MQHMLLMAYPELSFIDVHVSGKCGLKQVLILLLLLESCRLTVSFICKKAQVLWKEETLPTALDHNGHSDHLLIIMEMFLRVLVVVTSGVFPVR